MFFVLEHQHAGGFSSNYKGISYGETKRSFTRWLSEAGWNKEFLIFCYSEDLSLREKWQNTKLFLVRIYPYQEGIRKIWTRKFPYLDTFYKMYTYFEFSNFWYRNCTNFSYINQDKMLLSFRCDKILLPYDPLW